MPYTSTQQGFADVTVLVADDDQDICAVFRRGLQARGFPVETVQSVMGGVSEMAESDIMILDLELLNGDGRNLLYQWVKDKRQPVMVVSGCLEPKEKEELLEAGAWNVLPKPARLESVFYLVERYAHVVIDRRKCALVDKLQRRVQILTYVVVALVGTQGLSLFGIDIGTILQTLF